MRVKTEKNNILYFFIGLTFILTLINSWTIINIKKEISIDQNLGKNQVIQQQNDISNNKGNKIDVSLDDDPVKGNKNAKVVIVEFSDFQCPFCSRFFEQTLPLIQNDYIKTGKVKLIYRDFPLSFHQYAQKAAEAAQCANEQGKFWEYHDILFNRQNEWASSGETKFSDYAKELSLDVQKFNNCLSSGKYESEVKKDLQDGLSYGVQGTPTFFINGVAVVGAQRYDVFKQIIEQQLAG